MEHRQNLGDGDVFALPFKITLAIAAACDPTRLTLRPQERSLLCFLLQRVSATRPATPFRCRVDKLADQFDVTTRSIHNWMTALRCIGLITFKQRRNHFGSFGLGVALTDLAIQALGLDKTPLKQFTPFIREAQVEQPTCADSNQALATPPVKNISDTDRPENNLINNQPHSLTFSNKRCGEVPADVIKLETEHGLSKPTIFWLMKQASNKSNRLGSIYTIAGKYLHGLMPNQVKAYLMKCINSGTDYASVIAHKLEPRKAVDARDATDKAIDVLKSAINDAGGALPLRAGYWVSVEGGFLFKCQRLDNGRLDRLGVIAGDGERYLASLWSEAGRLDG
jgi:hypothetical protein